MKKILTIIGSTASGKTSLSVELAKKLDGEIIGLDSRQIYEGMSIGTAQPTQDEMEGIQHHLMGFQDPAIPISAGIYTSKVKEKVTEIQKNGKTPIICGGAGLYFRALKTGIFQGSVSDLPIRNRLDQAYEDDPVALLERLKFIDPEYAEIVHINNKKRLMRALEIYEITGRPPSEHFKAQKEKPTDSLNLYTILLNWNRQKIINRIERRTDEMLENGWIEEVESLLIQQEKSKLTYPGLNSIGYRQIQAYLKNEMTLDEMKEDIVIRTRQFARRQVQWFKKENIDLIIEMDNLDTEKIPQIIFDLIQS
ncbi:MAG: tRNA (adenosine(37)-N6)-dimethylallyltransferase MiaA [Candidatus Marinimicrobia bacterium]|mgnify:FL=1|jgi:tRNA dimethylallyltransferase|nr:tRNA (adenosine(37)-N6)-dimethylallyltransferase MiaA [Candidatus Neomarinimicrobiota bacterium]MBT3838752.1 tRNA (adenosine(37)-N6)-dimethylallyltransferase MiaA [Candidatus Neomarinimicrobiota bacterium]MBT4578761.1 tRNA (adenosine(37)-N6)-dimethylallyltransferase MiaA [Candidatus Neomarinimicrobiota bacterium]MBT7193980.1 tRNA (adenosine(37)-N6)-dimethylallyltransferase MiaA [Candidatus Neomarinimicrobiota bacterium]